MHSQVENKNCEIKCNLANNGFTHILHTYANYTLDELSGFTHMFYTFANYTLDELSR